MTLAHNKINRHVNYPQTALSTLTAAALVLPGLLQQSVQAADEDSVDFQYSYYQEGKRTNLSGFQYNAFAGSFKYAIPNPSNPIELDSLYGSAKVTLTDRVKFAFNYIRDTWECHADGKCARTVKRNPV